VKHYTGFFNTFQYNFPSPVYRRKFYYMKHIIEWILKGSDGGCWIKELGFWTLSIVRIFNKLNNDVSESGCLHPQVKGKKPPILLGPLERANPFTLLPEDGDRSSLRNVVCSVYWKSWRWIKSRSPIPWYHRMVFNQFQMFRTSEYSENFSSIDRFILFQYCRTMNDQWRLSHFICRL
jgi:hypothetical protein